MMQKILSLLLFFVAYSSVEAQSGERRESTNELRRASRWAIANELPTRVTAEIGIGQVELKDLKGALKTARAIRVARDEDQLCFEFFQQLVALQVKSGESLEPFKDLNRITGRNLSLFQQAEMMIAIALARAEIGSHQGAKGLCQNAFTNEGARRKPINFDLEEYVREIVKHIQMAKIGRIHKAYYLTKVIQIQIRIGDQVGSKETLRLIEKAAKSARPQYAEERALVYANLALAYMKTSGKRVACKAFDRALEALNQKSVNPEVQQFIAVALAKAGDSRRAIQMARSITEKSWLRGQGLRNFAQGQAFQQIAFLQLLHGDLAGAEHTALLIDEGQDVRTITLIEVGKKLAGVGKIEKAQSIINRISNDSQRAQGVLEVAAVLASNGRKRIARRMAVSLTFPRLKPIGTREMGIQFKFEDPDTWAVDYESQKAFTMSSKLRAERLAGELGAAAIRCHVALNGSGKINLIKALEKWNIRKAAAAQASAGDWNGALTWSSRLSREKRIKAVIGIAEGIIKYSDANRSLSVSLKLPRIAEALR
jgi:tetratricopeptide (TPR) repeat protein